MLPNGEGFGTNSFLVEKATFQNGASVPGSKKDKKKKKKKKKKKNTECIKSP